MKYKVIILTNDIERSDSLILFEVDENSVLDLEDTYHDDMQILTKNQHVLFYNTVDNLLNYKLREIKINNFLQELTEKERENVIMKLTKK